VLCVVDREGILAEEDDLAKIAFGVAVFPDELEDLVNVLIVVCLASD
jgi:hypothetical protein